MSRVPGEAVPRCIYCRSEGPFTAEHVIPEAFGLYGPETLVLNDAVCHECNQGFGRTLDQILARDSYEGLLRADAFPRSARRRDREGHGRPVVAKVMEVEVLEPNAGFTAPIVMQLGGWKTEKMMRRYAG